MSSKQDKEAKYKKTEDLLSALFKYVEEKENVIPLKKESRGPYKKNPLRDTLGYKRKYKRDPYYTEQAVLPPIWHYTKSKCERRMIIARYNKNKPKSEHMTEPCKYMHVTRDRINFAQCGICKQLFSISFFGSSEKATYTAIKWVDDD